VPRAFRISTDCLWLGNGYTRKVQFQFAENWLWFPVPGGRCYVRAYGRGWGPSLLAVAFWFN
jgi:hypothetical protein